MEEINGDGYRVWVDEGGATAHFSGVMRLSGAEEYAPYEYWGAVSYLEQAKTMMAYSEYERSFDYGVRAKQLADEAKKKSKMREAGEDVLTSEDADAGAGAAEGSAEGEASGGEVKGEAKGKIELGGARTYSDEFGGEVTLRDLWVVLKDIPKSYMAKYLTR